MAQRSAQLSDTNATAVDSVRTNSGATELSQKYCVIAALGQGGMSVVHLATARSLGNVQKLVVLKSIRQELLTSEKVRSMFMDEARLAIRLTHPNIVQTYEVVTIADRPVIVMEYMEGQAFSALQRAAAEHGGLSLALKLRVLIDALAGMEYAHNLSDYNGSPFGLVHRDISPQNVFVTYDGHVKILDFGIAKARDNSSHTEAGEIKGKIRYMAPEQMQGSAELDRRADIFAIGVMLWEALTEQRLWHREKDVEVFRAVLAEGVPPPSKMNPEVAPALEAVCVKAIARDPNDRYESCAAMQSDLERVCEELGLRTHNKDLGKLVQKIFAEKRSEIRKAIERKLKEMDSAPLNLRVDDGITSDSGLSAARSAGRTDTPSAVALAIGAPNVSRALTIVPLLVLAILGAWALLHAAPAAAPMAASKLPPGMNSGSPASAAPPSTPPRSTSVKLSATPTDAKLYLDDTLLASNPFSAVVARDDKKHEVRAEADGYVGSAATVWFNGASFVESRLELQRAPTRGKPNRGVLPHEKPKVVSSGRPAVAVPAANCDHPFFVDESGIRRVRPECL